MATREDLKAAYREVLSEPAVLDRIALAILKRDCYLVDPTGQTHKVVGTTNLAKKINYMAHNDAQQLALTAKIGAGVDGIAEMLDGWKGEMVLPDGSAPIDTVVPSSDGLQAGAEFVTPSAEVVEGGK